MKRLLVIASLHHASPRIPALLATFNEIGWQVTIVTPPLGEEAELVLGLPVGFTERVEIAVAPFRGDIFWIWRKVLRGLGFSNQSSYTEQIKEHVGGSGGRSVVDRLMRAYQAAFAIPDTEWPWHRSAFSTAQALLAAQHFDVVLSSSPHPTVHRVAARLKKLHKIKWVADFRDPWSQSHNYSLPKFRLHIDRWMEIRTLTNADLITTVSSGFAEKLVQLHGERVAVIPNGYQPMSDSGPAILPERFTISYTGTIYAGKQDPNKILATLSRLIEAGQIARESIALNFFGRYDSALQQAIADHGLVGVAVQLGSLPRVEIRRCQRSSHLLLLLQWEAPDEQGIFPLKFYEYLDAGRPILATGGAGSNEISTILDETHTGTTAVTLPEIEQTLLLAYEAYLTQGTPDYQGNPEAIARYSYAGCSRKLVECLEKIIQTD
jgi:glycosyltransferase involved in cell wall biosynthesis